MLETTQAPSHPALEALDASVDGLSRDVFEPAVLWLSVNDGLSTSVQILPANGRPACSNEVVADLFRGLSDGLVRLDGDRFVLTGLGVHRLQQLDLRATPDARQMLSQAPQDVDALLADVHRKVGG